MKIAFFYGLLLLLSTQLSFGSHIIRSQGIKFFVTDPINNKKFMIQVKSQIPKVDRKMQVLKFTLGTVAVIGSVFLGKKFIDYYVENLVIKLLKDLNQEERLKNLETIHGKQASILDKLAESLGLLRIGVERLQKNFNPT